MPRLLLVAFVDGALELRGNGFVGQALGPAGEANHAVNRLKLSGRLRCTRGGR